MIDMERRALLKLRKGVSVYGPRVPESVLCDYAAAALVAEGHDADLAADAVLRAYDANFRVWGPV